MKQRRISGIGGLSLEGVSYARDNNRMFWIMSNVQYLTLFTKMFTYSSDAADDPLDFTSGQQYYLGQGTYRGLTHALKSQNESSEVWTAIYSIDNALHRIDFDVKQKVIVGKVALNIVGYSPELFYKGSQYYLSFFNDDKLFISKTTDFTNFSTSQSAAKFKRDFNSMIYIADQNISFHTYHETNTYITTTFPSTVRY